MQVVATGLKCLGFVHEEVWSKHHTISNNVHLATLEDAGGDGTQHILLAFKFQRVTGIRSSLETGNHIVLRGQHIDHLTFSFVAPLQAQQDINFSFVHNALFIQFFYSLFCSDCLPYPDSSPFPETSAVPAFCDVPCSYAS